METLVAFFGISFFSAFYQALTGFGMGLVGTPLALLFLDKYTVVMAFAVLAAFTNGFLIKKIDAPINWKIVVPLAIGSVIGAPFGIWLLIITPINILKIVAGSLVILSIFLIIFLKSTLPTNRFLSGIVGFFSGLLNTSIGTPGPPVVLLLAGAKKEKNEMRKTMVTYFFWVNMISFPFFYFSGELTWERVSLGFYALPFLILGVYVGNRLSHKLPQKAYKILALVTVTVAGLAIIYSGLTG